MTQIPNSTHVSNFEFRILNLFRISDFGFRISHGGFTLIETLVALALVTAALIGPFSLATNAIANAKFFKNRLVAFNLAQEGLEITRHLRENNVIRGHHWRGLTGSCNASDLCTRLDDFSAYFVDVYTAPWGSARPPMPTAQLFYDAASALYSHSSAGGSAAPFQRTVAISTPGGNPDTNPQMLVVATVTWTELGLSREVRLEEVLYNWRSP